VTLQLQKMEVSVGGEKTSQRKLLRESTRSRIVGLGIPSRVDVIIIKFFASLFEEDPETLTGAPGTGLACHVREEFRMQEQESGIWKFVKIAVEKGIRDFSSRDAETAALSFVLWSLLHGIFSTRQGTVIFPGTYKLA
jgi:hypothetical protein